MKNINQRHQAFFFCDNGSISPTPASYSSLMTALGKFQLIPTISTEPNPMTGEERQFIIMANSDHSIRLEIPTSGFELVKESGTQEEFYDLVQQVFAALEAIYPNQKAHRISLLNSSFFQGNDGEYTAIYQQLFTNKEATPFEWDNRIVEKKTLEKSQEQINSISLIRRSEFRLQNINYGNSLDLICFDIDSNTDNNNASPRFSINKALSIWKELYENNKKLTESLQRYKK